MAYSPQFIKKVLMLLSNGNSYRELASKFNISPTTILNWKRGIWPKGKRNRPNTKLELLALKNDVEQYPDAYHRERAERLGVKKSCIGDNLKKLGVTYKKNADTPQSRRRKAIIIQTQD